MLALESAMDELAHRLGIDPIELRRRNEPTQDPEKDMPYSTRQLRRLHGRRARGASAGTQRHAQPGRRARGPLADRHRHERGQPRQPPERVAAAR